MEAIIFDLYDTLVRLGRETNPYRQFFELLPANLISYEDYRKLVMTRNFDSFEEIGSYLGQNRLAIKDLEKELVEEVKAIELFEDVAPGLEILSQNFELYLLSNLASPYKKPCYTLGLDKWISAFFFSCDIGHIKPSSEAYRYLLTAIDKKAEQVLMVGDSYKSDVEGPQKCGIQSLWLRRNAPAGEGHIRSISELVNILK